MIFEYYITFDDTQERYDLSEFEATLLVNQGLIVRISNVFIEEHLHSQQFSPEGEAYGLLDQKAFFDKFLNR